MLEFKEGDKIIFPDQTHIIYMLYIEKYDSVPKPYFGLNMPGFVAMYNEGHKYFSTAINLGTLSKLERIIYEVDDNG